MTFALPQKKDRREARVDDKVARAVNRTWKRPFALEVKMHDGNVKEHQDRALTQVAKNTFKPYKIPDQGRRNPFDYIGLYGADAILCTVDKNEKNADCYVYNTDTTIKIKL